MHYTTITAGELRKMDWVKVKLERRSWKLDEWIIKVEWKEVNVLYDWKENYLVMSFMDDSFIADINRLETIEEITEWELVYVSDKSVEDAIKRQVERVYICTTSKWIHVIQDQKEYRNNGYDYISWRKYIAKIPKEETVEMTMEEVCKALWKKVKIIE